MSRDWYFYPRSPCGERPFKIGENLMDRKHFYPRSPCGERLYLVRGQRPNWRISIHALLAESDGISSTLITGFSEFLSTLSLRRATPPGLLHSLGGVISIHALLAESDAPWLARLASCSYFYPRSPCGERHCIIDIINNIIDHFYPRSPCGERQLRNPSRPGKINFYPRSPCGERQYINSRADDIK